MMMSPEVYIDEQKNKSYDELLKEKERLVKDIEQYENNPDFEEIIIDPSPDVRYQCNLEYLSELCKLIADKFMHENFYKNRQKNKDIE